jgi:hypothetical protein
MFIDVYTLLTGLLTLTSQVTCKSLKSFGTADISFLSIMCDYVCCRYVGVFPHFDDKLDSLDGGSMFQNHLTMQLGPTSVFMFDVSTHLPLLIANPYAVDDILRTRSLFADYVRFHWNFDDSSLSRSNFDTCFRDFARTIGQEKSTEVNAASYVEFDVCASSGQPFVTMSPLVVTDAALQNVSVSNNLKSRGWMFHSGGDYQEKPPAGRAHMVGDTKRVLAYIECQSLPCNNEMWIALQTRNRSSWSWTLLPAVLSPSMKTHFSSVPSFQGPSLQYQNSRVYVIGGKLQSSSSASHQGRFTVATFDLNVDTSRALVNVFVHHEFSALVDSTSTSNGTHAFIFGGQVGWGRTENSVLVLSYQSMQVSKLLAAPTAPFAALFSGVKLIHFTLSFCCSCVTFERRCSNETIRLL